MPIHLPPISRREFLSKSLAAGAGVLLGPKLFAATKKTETDSWALLADIHLAGDRSKMARGINMTDHFTQVSKEVLDPPKRPNGVFVVGDCAFNSGEPGDYSVVSDLLRPVREGQMPVHLALGNHDNRERFWEAFEAEKSAKRPLADRQVAILRTPKANWFVLDSLEKTLSTPGFLGPEQLEWLAKALDANSDQPALVLIHHNPGIEGNIGLKDSGRLFEIIRPRKQVKAYIFGHTHHWNVETDSSGIHLINLPPVSYLFQEGDPAGWVHATVNRNGMKLELRAIDQTHPGHGKKIDLQWRTA